MPLITDPTVISRYEQRGRRHVPIYKRVRVGRKPHYTLLQKVFEGSVNRKGWTPERKNLYYDITRDHRSAWEDYRTLRDEEQVDRETLRIARETERAITKQRKQAKRKDATEQRKLRKQAVKPIVSTRVVKLLGINYTREEFAFNPKYRIDSAEDILEFFEKVIQEAVRGMVPDDKIQISFSHDNLHMGWWSSRVVFVNALNSTDVIESLAGILQSAEILSLEKMNKIVVARMLAPRGGARLAPHDLDSALSMKSVEQIVNNGVDCAMRAFIISEASLTLEKNSNDYQSLRRQRKPLDDKVRSMYRWCNLPRGKMLTIEDLCHVVTERKRNILIVDVPNGSQTWIVKGVNDESYVKTPAALLKSGDHFHAITDIAAYVGNSYFCYECLQGYQDRNKHKCEKKNSPRCRFCSDVTCPGASITESTFDDLQRCSDCNCSVLQRTLLRLSLQHYTEEEQMRYYVALSQIKVLQPGILQSFVRRY